jgi:hypothetical protein
LSQDEFVLLSKTVFRMLAMSLRPVIGLVLLFALSNCTTLDVARKPLPIGEVVELSKAGTPPALIIQRIRDSHTTYALRGADFPKLKAHWRA